MTWVLAIHAAATWSMVGVIWMVQVVHYPLFAEVGAAQFAAYERSHQQRITWIVAPLMLIELLSAVWLVASPPSGVARWILWLGLALVLVNWGSTALVQVPLHERLAAGFSEAAHARLVATNWVRTASWTLRGGLAGWLLVRVT